ncbi:MULTISPECIES: SUMF1/EgtB/PvdO family nonheme iron enzyme [unclassified Fibrobacter]|uniref:SUMF1/EgtB/PvdO family nonheme iron enzyme n=1 Tax=unclassified Fibrobacter TaxID=2634177 RepID=UPI000D6AF941|nr:MULTISPECIES: SUMF1/EgtB/PvdO family nonheme iron enzyme [unclassified Fibrobacter]PWJ64922.1 sulfatase-modifying factor enzyme 1 [Fibrobacter sp. UWR4]PZW68987.1 sulfatase-modifying factor enzyme 1 [Fibrobacter sp. UWR1]
MLDSRFREDANGYRLPFYDEWMALAKAGKIGRKYVWGNSESKDVASQYAWFGEGIAISKKYGVYQQESKPVGMKKPNDYGLYDMTGLVCEHVMLPGKSIFGNEITSCKGGFLYDSLQSLNFGAHMDNSNGGFGGYQGLRLVRKIK